MYSNHFKAAKGELVSSNNKDLPKRFCIQYGLPHATDNNVLGLPNETICYNNNFDGFRPVEGSIYVLREFESPLYEDLRTTKTWILGPPAFQQMVEENECNLRPQPTYNNCMKNLVFFINLPGKLKRRAAELIMWMSGRFVDKEPDSNVTHMVTTSTRARGYDYCNTFNVPIIKPQWLEDCWSSRDTPSFDPISCQSAYKLETFAGLFVHVCQRGFNTHQVDNIVTALYDGNAELVAITDPSITHMVVSEEASKDATLELPPSVEFIVSSDWVLDSFLYSGREIETRYEIQRLMAQYCDEENLTEPRPPSKEPDIIMSVPPVEIIQVDSDSTESDESVICTPRPAQTAVAPRTKLRRSKSLSSSQRSSSGDPEEELGTQSMKPINITKRKFIIEELLNTERNYIMCIRALVAMKNESEKHIINRAESKMIFGNVDKLLCLHENIANYLETGLQSNDELALVGEVFIQKKEPLMEEYVIYSKQVLECQKLFASKYQDHVNFRKVADDQTRDHLAGEPRDLFVRPVQRLCSVCLLLKEIQKYTPEQHDDKKKLPEAICVVNNILLQMNKGREETEQIHRLFEVHGLIDGFPVDLISSHRKYISKFHVKELDLKKYKSGQNLVLFLFNDVILVAKNVSTKKSKGKPYAYLDSIYLTFVDSLLYLPEKRKNKEVFGIVMRGEHGEIQVNIFLYPEQEHDLSDFLMAIADHLASRDSSKSPGEFIVKGSAATFMLQSPAYAPQSDGPGTRYRRTSAAWKASRAIFPDPSQRRSNSCSRIKDLCNAL